MSPVAAYAVAFLMTEVVEAPVYALVLTRVLGARLGTALLASAAVNAVSHPVFTFVVLPLCAHVLAARPALLVSELFVCLLEAALLCAAFRRHAAALLAASLVANGCSLLAGAVVFSLTA